jgi:ethanolamine utilization protein EutQ (cupin superfamily)
MLIQKFAGVTTADLPSVDIPNVDALLKDFATLNSSGSPITFGVFRMGQGEVLPYTYEFDEFKLVLEGEIAVTDDAGAEMLFKAGDVIQFTKGAKVAFSSPSTGLTFYVAQR